jgi:hypothetical protein
MTNYRWQRNRMVMDFRGQRHGPMLPALDGSVNAGGIGYPSVASYKIPTVMHVNKSIGILIAGAWFFASACAQSLSVQESSPSPKGLPLRKTEPDRRPRFTFDPASPFHLEFGRGSGQYGLDTIVFDQTGHVVVHRAQADGYWEKAELELPKNRLQRLVKAIVDLRLGEMAASYSANVDDGAQWVFWLQQGDHEKSVYFDNHFPAAIQTFATQLDAELQQAGLRTAKWQRTYRQGPEHSHDKAIWKSIEKNN